LTALKTTGRQVNAGLPRSKGEWQVCDARLAETKNDFAAYGSFKAGTAKWRAGAKDLVVTTAVTD